MQDNLLQCTSNVYHMQNILINKIIKEWNLQLNKIRNKKNYPNIILYIFYIRVQVGFASIGDVD